MTITPIYAAIAALLFVALSARTIRGRRTAGVALGDGDDRLLQRAIRAHGNFAEYVPFTILLMALAELRDGPVWTVHVIGLTLLAGRMIHALGVSREPEQMRLRTLGMALTFTALITGALANLGLTGLVSYLIGLVGS
ncbi:MAG: MAPEG family protein [Methyloligellaceae bacterium]